MNNTKVVDYWKNKLGGEITYLQISAKKKAQSNDQPPNYISKQIVFSLELAKKIEDFCREFNFYTADVLLATFKILIMRYSKQEDITIYSLNTQYHNFSSSKLHIFRDQLNGEMNFLDCLNKIKLTIDESYQYKKFLDKIIDHQHAIYQVRFDFTSNKETIDHSFIQTELALIIESNSDKLVGKLEFKANLFENYFIENMLSNFQMLLNSAIDTPKKSINMLSILSEAEKNRLVNEWNNTKVDFPNKSMSQLFEEQVENTPNNIAVNFKEIKFSYEDLNKKANQLARYLQEKNIHKGDIVGICLDRSCNIYTALLAVLKSGSAYLPLNIDLPLESLIHITTEAQPRAIITQKSFLDKLSLTNIQLISLDDEEEHISRMSDVNLMIKNSLNDLAYIIYTSGSTGQPKGVMIEHRGLCNLVTHKDFDGQTKRRVLQFAPFSFDASVTDFFMALIGGGELIMIPNEVLQSETGLVQFLLQNNITAVTLPPSILAMLPPEMFPQLATVISGGEACPLAIAKRWAVGRKFFNAYGPTETTVGSTLSRIQPDDERVTIGKPLNNTEIYILDQSMQLVPIGVSGEIYIGGVGLARGYLNRPDLTQEKFVSNPFSLDVNSKLYKTGDIGRYLPDGQIEFLGRIDRQIKLHGLRIELEEIESALLQNTKILEAAVTLNQRTNNDKYIIAYLFLKDPTCTIDEIRNFILSKLPIYMLPSHFIICPKPLPRTVNGKINYHALKDFQTVEKKEVSDHVAAPKNSIEKKITQFCSKLLNIKKLNLNDNLIEVGLNSLLMMKLNSKIIKTYQVQIPINLFISQLTSIRDIAKFINDNQMAQVNNNSSNKHNNIIFKLNKNTEGQHLFCIHPVGGNIISYALLAKLLEKNYSVYGIQSPGLEGETKPFTDIVKMAEFYLSQVRTMIPKGPYSFLGWSTGGIIAYEMARQFNVNSNEKTKLLALVDTDNPIHMSGINKMTQQMLYKNLVQLIYASFGNIGVKSIPWRIKFNLFLMSHFNFIYPYLFPLLAKMGLVDEGLNIKNFIHYLAFLKSDLTTLDETKLPIDKIVHLLKKYDIISSQIESKQIKYYYEVVRANFFATENYCPSYYDGHLLLFRIKERSFITDWKDHANRVELITIPGNHFNIFQSHDALKIIQEKLNGIQNES